jgi:hypothetical protein
MFSPLAAALCGSQIRIEIGNRDGKNRMIADCVIVETVGSVEKSNTVLFATLFSESSLKTQGVARASAVSGYSWA